MDNMLDTVFGLLVAPPGNLIYHLSLAFSVFASLQVTWINRRNAQPAHIGRTLMGLSVLLVAQLLHFLSSGLAWQGVLNSHLFLPVLDRAIILLSVIWIAWLWLFPTPSRFGDVATGVLSAGVVGLFLFTFVEWSQSGLDVDFNASWIDWTWVISMAAIAFIAMVLLVVLHPPEWGVGFGMVWLALTGALMHLLMAPAQGDFSGFIRLMLLAAFPLLPALLVRSPRTASAGVPVVATARAAQPQAEMQLERKSRSSDPRTVHSWLELSLKSEPDEICQGVARAVGQTMVADLCFVAAAPSSETGPVILQCGYDLIREDQIPGMILDGARVPGLAGALSRGKAVRWNAGESKPQDLQGLSAALGLKDSGNVLLIPLPKNNAPWGGLLLLTSYSQRPWTVDDQNYLASEADSLAKLLLNAQGLADRRQELQLISAQLEEMQTAAANLEHENKQLLDQLAQRVQQPAGNGISDLEGLMALQKENQDMISGLQAENERLRSMSLSTDSSTDGYEMHYMENELRSSLQEVARLQNLLAASNIKVLELERKLGATVVVPNEDREVIASIVQELRQPMSSIMGYTDLLLAESVGILGALQRKFLERVRASTERLRGLMDDLIQVSSLGSGALELVHQPVDLSEVIDNALVDVSSQLREKNITMRVDLPEEMPPVHADRDALQQIVSQLLQNASGATPEEGVVSLKARVTSQNNSEFLTLQVTDSGGGIPLKDLPRVFARRYRADNALVEGIGDTGVGLSIAKTLVEAHGGRIWVDSEMGESSTFTILLPVRPEEPVAE